MATVAALSPTGDEVRYVRRVGVAAGVLLAIAAGAHLAAFLDRRGEGMAAGGLFLVVALLQLAAAVMVARTNAPTRAAIVAGTLGLLALWARSRTAGLPIGAHPGLPERVGVLDTLAAGTQVLSLGTVALLGGRRSRGTLVRPGIVLVVLALVVAGGSAWLAPSSHAPRGHDLTDTPVQVQRPAKQTAISAGGAHTPDASGIDGTDATGGGGGELGGQHDQPARGAHSHP